MSTHRISFPSPARRRGAAAAFGVASLGLLVAGFVGATTPASALGAPVGLGTAASYAVLAGSTVTNTGPSMIHGDLGVSPGSAVAGFPPGTVVPPGVIHASDAAAAQAQVDLTTAYNDAAGRASNVSITGQDLGGQTLTTGVYTASTSQQLTGALTLDAKGDPNAVFVFQIGSTLTTASGSSVLLINGASPCNVYWQVGTSATLGTGTAFAGTIMALTSTTLNTTATVEGRVLARNGAVTLDNNVITTPNCATSSDVTATPTSAATTPTKAATKKHHTSTNHGSTSNTPSTPTTPVIPTGHPSTGVGVAPASSDTGGNGSGMLFALAGLAGIAALIAALLAAEPRAIRMRR
jgi:hypothetical protein